MRKILSVAIVLALVFGVCGIVQAQQDQPKDQPKGDMQGCPMAKDGKCAMCMGDKKDMCAHMEKMGMDKSACTRVCGMMRAELKPTDPALLAAMKDDLKLTDDQITKIKKIQDDAAQQAQAVLTDEQKQMVDQMKSAPASMADMHKKMVEKKRSMKKDGEMMKKDEAK